MNETTIYDAIIVGAGPAGSICAYDLAKDGKSVLLIDEKKELGYPIQCAESVSVDALRENGIKENKEWIVNYSRGVHIHVPDGNYYKTGVKLCNLDRRKFDRFLAERARDMGAKLNLKTRFQGAAHKAETWTIATSQGNFRSKYLIGADGYKSNVAKDLGMFKSGQIIVARQYKVKNNDAVDGDWSHVFLSKKYKNGYGWVFVRGDHYNIGVGAANATYGMLNDLCKTLEIDTSEKRIAGGAIPLNYKFNSLTDERGALVVGDAGGLINPITYGGIYPGLVSGKIASKTIIRAINDQKGIQNYTKEINEKLNMKLLNRGAEAYYSLNDDEWNFIARVMDGRDSSEVTAMDGLKALLREPGYMKIARRLALLNKVLEVN